MQRLGTHTGFFEIDHRDSPGVTAADLVGIPGAIAVGAGQHLERDVKQCSHCQRMVVLEPARVRARAVCPGCYSYICDGCETIRAVAGQCVPFKAVLDEAATIAEKFVGQPDHPDAVMDPVAIARHLSERVTTATPSIVLTDA